MNIDTIANIGDTIYLMAENKVTTGVVKYIKIEITKEQSLYALKDVLYIQYRTSDGAILYNKDIFLTKQELLDSL